MDTKEKLKSDFENTATLFEKVFEQLVNPKTVIGTRLNASAGYHAGLLNSGAIGYPKILRITDDCLSRKMIGVYKTNGPYPEIRIALGTGNIQLYTGVGVICSILETAIDPIGNLQHLFDDIYVSKKKRWGQEMLDFVSQLRTPIGEGIRYKIDARIDYSYDPTEQRYVFGKYSKDFDSKTEIEQSLADLISLEQLIWCK